MAANPFKPTFGSPPPLLVGRDVLIEDFGAALDEGPGSPGRALIITGARGVGKTVALTALEGIARQRGWDVVSETATPGIVDRIASEHLPVILSRRSPRRRHRITGISGPAAIGGVTWSSEDRHPSHPGLRSMIEDVSEALSKTGTGLLFTVDELGGGGTDELRLLGSEIQHAFRRSAEVAFAGAGLPRSVSTVLSDRVLTFLRRAERHHLGPVSLRDVASALREPIHACGRRIGDEALDKAAAATFGFPFLIQLVGRWSWAHHPDEIEITVADVEAGVMAAKRRMGSLVHEPSLVDLSPVDRTFLLAMSEDDGPSRMTDIAARLDVDANYASQYRLRLLAAEMITASAYGRVNFVAPYLREYLREHAASGLSY